MRVVSERGTKGGGGRVRVARGWRACTQSGGSEAKRRLSSRARPVCRDRQQGGQGRSRGRPAVPPTPHHPPRPLCPARPSVWRTRQAGGGEGGGGSAPARHATRVAHAHTRARRRGPCASHHPCGGVDTHTHTHTRTHPAVLLPPVAAAAGSRLDRAAAGPHCCCCGAVASTGPPLVAGCLRRALGVASRLDQRRPVCRGGSRASLRRGGRVPTRPGFLPRRLQKERNRVQDIGAAPLPPPLTPY